MKPKSAKLPEKWRKPALKEEWWKVNFTIDESIKYSLHFSDFSFDFSKVGGFIDG